jgi:hypothetical protein
VAVIAGMLAQGGDDDLLIARVVSALVKAGFRRATARAAAGVTIRTRALSYPGTRTPAGPGSVANDRREPAYDAWFVANSARRIAERVNAGKDPEDAIRPERTYVDQRERARRARRDAADKVDAATKTPGNLVVNGRTVLGWAAHGDDKTTWECVAADGHWFYADRPPVIGYPGTDALAVTIQASAALARIVLLVSDAPFDAPVEVPSVDAATYATRDYVASYVAAHAPSAPLPYVGPTPPADPTLPWIDTGSVFTTDIRTSLNTINVVQSGTVTVTLGATPNEGSLLVVRNRGGTTPQLRSRSPRGPLSVGWRSHRTRPAATPTPRTCPRSLNGSTGPHPRS